jgi:Na+-transporting methylmalonyl-CoA/oxaloacetate decarboxylase gamma subunit
MAKPTVPQSLDKDGEQSVGDLVAQAVKDVTQLARFEFDLAKLELRADARRLGLAAALLAIVAAAACLVVVLCSFALVYGLITLGIWDWAAFLIVAGVCVVLAALVILIVWIKVRGMSGLRETRKTVQEDFAMLKRDQETPAKPAVEAG